MSKQRILTRHPYLYSGTDCWVFDDERTGLKEEAFVLGMASDHFDIVVVDEFHHAAAPSYTRLLDHVKPRELLGLTATPERSDGLPVLSWFDDRIAAELRLWDAIDQHRLTPFVYYGSHDNTDLRDVPWRRGAAYDVERLTEVLTANDAVCPCRVAGA